MLATIERVSGRRFPVEYVERRDGDSPALVADNAKAKSVLGWAPSHDLTSIVETAWNWHSRTNLGAEYRQALLTRSHIFEGMNQWHFSAFEPGTPSATATPTCGRLQRLHQSLADIRAEMEREKNGLRDRYEKVMANAAFSQQLAGGRAARRIGMSSKIDDMTGTMIRYTKRLASLQAQIDFVTEMDRRVEAFSQASTRDESRCLA